jgi:hypothetical protein
MNHFKVSFFSIKYHYFNLAIMKTQEILLKGLKTLSNKDKIKKLMNNFEYRMLERLERDFYKHGKNLLSYESSYEEPPK